MRQGQHNNKRMRGRNRGKGPNPLTRSYESNGGDVKIRGTALHVAEKYVQLARDAQASGDRVAQENYLQHAEHYYRIVAAAQAQMPQPQPIYRNDEEGDDEEGTAPDNRPAYGNQQRPPMQPGGQQQYHQPYQQQPYQQQPYQQHDQQPYVNGNNGAYNGGSDGQDISTPADEAAGDQRDEQRNDFRGEPRGENADNRGERSHGRHRRRRPYRDNYGDRGEARAGTPDQGEAAPEPRGDE